MRVQEVNSCRAVCGQYNCWESGGWVQSGGGEVRRLRRSEDRGKCAAGFRTIWSRLIWEALSCIAKLELAHSQSGCAEAE